MAAGHVRWSYGAAPLLHGVSCGLCVAAETAPRFVGLGGSGKEKGRSPLVRTSPLFSDELCYLRRENSSVIRSRHSPTSARTAPVSMSASLVNEESIVRLVCLRSCLCV